MTIAAFAPGLSAEKAPTTAPHTGLLPATEARTPPKSAPILYPPRAAMSSSVRDSRSTLSSATPNVRSSAAASSSRRAVLSSSAEG
jgi:hypothetical protein